MPQTINTNISSLNSQWQLNTSQTSLSTSMERLSSGLRVNSAKDDAAGLAIADRMNAQIRGTNVAIRNANDGISLAQTAEGALNTVHSMLQRVRELAVQFKNGSLSATNQAAIQSEVNQLASEIERIGSSAEFNGTKLLNSAQTISFQVGSEDGQTITVSTISLGGTAGVGTSYIALNSTNATDISEIDAAIDNVSAQRAAFGAVQNRLEYTVNALGIYQENLMAAESRIRDVDMAQEMTNFTKLQILQQSGTAMLAQANMASQSILSLLQ